MSDNTIEAVVCDSDQPSEFKIGCLEEIDKCAELARSHPYVATTVAAVATVSTVYVGYRIIKKLIS